MTEFPFLLYTAEDRDIKVDAILKDEMIWLFQKGMAELFDVEVLAISKHLTNIFAEGELSEDATVSKMEIVQQEGKRQVEYDIFNKTQIIHSDFDDMVKEVLGREGKRHK